MKPTRQLHDFGQSLWLDSISRGMLENGTLKRYIDDLGITGLTSNPTIFEQAIAGGSEYDKDIQKKITQGKEGEALFFELAIDDLTRAADLFKPAHERTDGVDGFVSLEVSPKLAYDTQATIRQAKDLHSRANRPNLFIKIPGTPEGLPAIEDAIFHGIPINVTLLFSREQYVAAAEAYMRGIEKRITAGLNPHVASVASLFISRWDRAVAEKVPANLKDKLGVAIGRRTYKAYRDLLNSQRWQRLANFGARPQRLLWASTGTKDPKSSDVLYIEGLLSPFTINTMPEKTLLAFADHGKVGQSIPADGGDCEKTLAEFTKAGINLDRLALDLQKEGAEAFVKSWNELLKRIAAKSEALAVAGKS